MKRFFIIFICSLLLAACSPQTGHLMFVPDENFENDLDLLEQENPSSYTISPFDILRISVVNKGGEILIDPEFQLESSFNPSELRRNIEYRVNENGEINMPMIGFISVEGLDINQAEILISNRFTEKYDQPFTQVTILNKRAVILGSGYNMVVPLTYEGVSLAEVLAASVTPALGKAANIRLIRGDQVYLIDLSTMEGARWADLKIAPEDIIYVEPVEPTKGEKLREISPLIGIISGLASIVAIILSVAK